MSIKTIEKVILEDYKRGASEENEKGLDYEIIERVIEETLIHKITLEELLDKVNQIANSDHGTIVAEVIGVLTTPAVIYEDFKAVISQKEVEDGVEESFILLDYTEEVGNLEFDTLAAKGVVWDKWGEYFLIKFLEDNIEIMLSYHDYKF
ncbi:hypothetical protein ACJDU8_02460 [Clostridium sp. WILCCON 0269]|uniref:Uncharacterized protein n=1 Tax=Candidatus Clostridium eludens TaxID=3381663 RepID=A0ABW8SGY5_9CLOT